MKRTPLIILYKKPRCAAEGVRRELRLLRTHLGAEFDLRLVAQDGDGPVLLFDIWVDLVVLLLEREPTPENARQLLRLYGQAKMISHPRPGSPTDIVTILEDRDGSMERQVTRRFFGNLIHERGRYQRELGRTDIRRKYAWVLGPDFLKLEPGAINALQSKAKQNRLATKPVENFWPWWYFRFLSNWKLSRQIVDPDKFLRIENLEKIPPAVRVTTAIIPSRARAKGPMAGADFIVVNVEEMALRAADELVLGADRTVDIILRFHRKGRRQEFDIVGLEGAKRIAVQNGFSLRFARVSLNGLVVRSSFVRNVLEPGPPAVVVNQINLSDCEVYGGGLDLSKASLLDDLHLSDNIGIASLRLPCGTESSLRKVFLKNDEAAETGPVWEPFDESIPKDCLQSVTQLYVIGGVKIEGSFLRVLSGMENLETLQIQDPVGWRTVVEIINKSSKKDFINVTFLYKRTSPPFSAGRGFRIGKSQIRFNLSKREKIVIVPRRRVGFP